MTASVQEDNYSLSTQSDLSALALDAAIAIERLLQKDPLATDDVYQFLRTVAETAGFERESGSISTLANPAAVDVFGRAFTVSTTEQLAEKLAALSVDNLDISVWPEDHLQQLKRICLAVHREVIQKSYEIMNQNHTGNGTDREKIRFY